jgi:hypothetical protein
MTDMFRFNSCIWKVDPLDQISKCKKRTLRGVFLSLAKTKYAFTFEHSVSCYDSKLGRGVPWTEKTLRDMGAHICSAFGKFVLSSLKSPQIFFSEYYQQTIDKSPGGEEKKRAAFADFSNRLSAVLEGREPIIDLDCLVGSMQQYETQVEQEDYSEGGSDSEFSEEDLKGAEKRALLSNIAHYTESYSKGQPVVNFAKAIKQDLTRIQNKKKRNEVEEFVKLKEFKQRFEGLEKRAALEGEKQFKMPQINFSFQKGISDPSKKQTLELIKQPIKSESKPLSSNRQVAKLDPMSMKRDRTMPLLKRGRLQVPAQSLVIEAQSRSQNIDSKSLILGMNDQSKRSFLLNATSPPQKVATRAILKPDSREKDMNASRILPSNSVHESVILQNSLPRRKFQTKMVTVNHSNDRYNPRASIFKDLLAKDIQEMKHNFMQEIDLQKKLIAQTTKDQRHRNPISISIQNLELNICASSRPAIHRPRNHNFPAAFYTRPPNYY